MLGRADPFLSSPPEITSQPDWDHAGGLPFLLSGSER
jgi:hypothetical protein